MTTRLNAQELMIATLTNQLNRLMEMNIQKDTQIKALETHLYMVEAQVKQARMDLESYRRPFKIE